MRQPAFSLHLAGHHDDSETAVLASRARSSAAVAPCATVRHIGPIIDDDALLYSYCWEALRFNPINPFVIRRCSKDYRIAAGTLRSATIKAGKTVLVSTRSAMRDGRELPAADSFAIDRPAYHYKHLGYGMHTCLGEHVSRVQVPEVIKRLPKLPGVRPTGPIDFKGGPFPESYVLEFN